MSHQIMIPSDAIGAGAGSGVQFASGTATSSSGQSTFYDKNNGSSLLGTLTVTGLSFKPSIILCVAQGNTVGGLSDSYYLGGKVTTLAQPTTSYNAPIQYGTNFYQVAGAASVTSTGFSMPVSNGGYSYNWYAYA